MLAVPACKYRAAVDAHFQSFFDWAAPIITVELWFADERTLDLPDDEMLALTAHVVMTLIDDPALLADFIQHNRKSAPKVFRAIR